MVLGAVGSFFSTTGGALLNAASSVVTEVASVVEAYPLATAAVIGYCAYQYYNNPDHLGNNVDTTA